MFPSKWTTMKALLVTGNVLLVLCLQCYAAERSDSDAEYNGGGGSRMVAPRTQSTEGAEVDEGDAEATLRESFVKAVRRNTRSHTQDHAIASGSLEDLVTPTQMTFLNLAHLYLPALTNVSQVCRRDLTAFYLAMANLGTLIKNGTLWPLKLVDSWGKLSDGILEGNVRPLGFFKECLDIRVYQPPEALDHPSYPLKSPPQSLNPLSKPFNYPLQRQNSLSQPINAHSPSRNYFIKAQNVQSHLHDQQSLTQPPVKHQFPPLVHEGLNLPHMLLRVPSQPSSDPQQSPRLPPHVHKDLTIPQHLEDQPRDGPLNYADLDGSTSTTTTPLPLPLADFSGQYCLLTYTKGEGSLEFPHDSLRTPTLSTAFPIGLSFLAYGTCIPSTCTRDELQVSVEEVLRQEGLRVAALDCQVKGRRPTLGAAEVTGIVVMSLLVTLMVLGALADLLTDAPARQHLRQGPLQYLLVFSATTNLQKVFHLETRKLPGVISSIHAIRFISIMWVVLGHQYSYSMKIIENLAELPELSKMTSAQILLNADKSVDTFFMLGGLLVTLGLLGRVSTAGRFNLPIYLLHRLMRLGPPVALSTMLVATLSGLAVSGPYASQYWIYVVRGCRERWWADVLLINNLLFPFLDHLHVKEGEGACCLPHTWYLGVDTQLYLIMPLLLLPLVWWPRKGWAWLLLWTVASVIIPGAIIGAYDLWPTSLFVIDPSAMEKYNLKVYLMPWCRAGPYLVGAWAGYLLHYAKDHPSITRLKRWQVCLGWLAAAAIAFGVLFGIAPYNYIGMPSQVPQMSRAEAVVYGGMHRAAWGLAVAWVVVACTWGYGGPVAWLLEHPLWQPFSRLTYCTYLVSLPLQLMIIFSAKSSTYFTLYGKLQETAGVLLVILLVALFVTLAAESPILQLEKILLRRSPGGDSNRCPAPRAPLRGQDPATARDSPTRSREWSREPVAMKV